MQTYFGFFCAGRNLSLSVIKYSICNERKMPTMITMTNNNPILTQNLKCMYFIYAGKMSGVRKARARLVLKLLCVFASMCLCVRVCVCVCSSAIITCAKLRHSVSMPLKPRAHWKLLGVCPLYRYRSLLGGEF